MYGKKMPEHLRRKRSKLVNWCHPIHGIVLNTSAPDLSRIFPDQNLDPSTLSKVNLGKLRQHKGWAKCVESSEA
jgi:hypothetical protein